VLLAIMVMPTLGWHWLLALSTLPLLAFALITPASMKYSAFVLGFYFIVLKPLLSIILWISSGDWTKIKEYYSLSILDLDYIYITLNCI